MARGYMSVGRSGPRIGVVLRLPRLRWLPVKWEGEHTFVICLLVGIISIAGIVNYLIGN